MLPSNINDYQRYIPQGPCLAKGFATQAVQVAVHRDMAGLAGTDQTIQLGKHLGASLHPLDAIVEVKCTEQPGTARDTAAKIRYLPLSILRQLAEKKAVNIAFDKKLVRLVAEPELELHLQTLLMGPEMFMFQADLPPKIKYSSIYLSKLTNDMDLVQYLESTPQYILDSASFKELITMHHEQFLPLTQNNFRYILSAEKLEYLSSLLSHERIGALKSRAIVASAHDTEMDRDVQHLREVNFVLRELAKKMPLPEPTYQLPVDMIVENPNVSLFCDVPGVPDGQPDNVKLQLVEAGNVLIITVTRPTHIPFILDPTLSIEVRKPTDMNTYSRTYKLPFAVSNTTLQWQVENGELRIAASCA